jgi:hypothetical protein
MRTMLMAALAAALGASAAVQGWNYAVRLYRPRAEILDGKIPHFPVPNATGKGEAPWVNPAPSSTSCPR